MHKTVLLREAIEELNIKNGDVVVDATLGAGGHAIELAKEVGESGKVIAFDLDQEAIEIFKEKIQKDFPDLKNRIELVNANFAEIFERVSELGFSKVDGILADLGWRSEQIENKKYGMSFQEAAPLDMRLGAQEDQATARQIVNEWREEDLEEIFKEYGEERHARKAAQAIVEARKEKPIETTKELAEIIKNKLGFFYKKQKIHPATRVFQALRIEVNRELDNLKSFLEASDKILKPGGRIAVIGFHSLEDRVVKRFFKTNAGGCICPKELPVCVCDNEARYKIITKKPIVPTDGEVEDNPRSRSAKLRVAEKI